MTFAIPDGLFIIVAVILFLIYKRPHQTVGLGYLAGAQVVATSTLDVATRKAPSTPPAPSAPAAKAPAPAAETPASETPADASDKPGEADAPEDTK
jgi:hypothetical protein